MLFYETNKKCVSIKLCWDVVIYFTSFTAKVIKTGTVVNQKRKYAQTRTGRHERKEVEICTDTTKYVNIQVGSSENRVGVGEILCLVWYASLF
jgi:hypothetical protein